MKPIYTDHENDILKKYYPVYGIKKCREFIKRTNTSVAQRVRAMGLKRIDGWRSNQAPIEDVLDFKSPSGAYLLGLIWADGTISYKSDGYTVSIGLISSDLNTIESLFSQHWKTYIRKNKEISWKPFHFKSISHKKLCQKLHNLDYSDKSNTSPCKILAEIPIENHCYFFRGWHDGDGYSKGIGKNKLSYSISGSYNQDWSVLKIKFAQLGIRYKISQRAYKSCKSSEIWIGGERDIRFWLNYIYSGIQMGITRKYNDYDCFLRERNKPKKLSGIIRQTNKRKSSVSYTVSLQSSGLIYKSQPFDSFLEAAIEHDRISKDILNRDLTFLYFPNRHHGSKDYNSYGFTDKRSISPI